MVAVVLPLTVSANDLGRITVERDIGDGASKPSLRLALNVTIPIATLVDLLVKVQEVQKQVSREQQQQQQPQAPEQYDPKASQAKAKTPLKAMPGSTFPASSSAPSVSAALTPGAYTNIQMAQSALPTGLQQSHPQGVSVPAGKGHVIPAKSSVPGKAVPPPGKANELSYSQYPAVPSKGTPAKMPGGLQTVDEDSSKVGGHDVDLQNKREREGQSEQSSQDRGSEGQMHGGELGRPPPAGPDAKTIHGIPGKKLAKLLKSIAEVLVERKSDERVLVQSNSTPMVKWLGDQLMSEKYEGHNMFACVVHDQLDQASKENALGRFRSGEANVLVTTNDTFKAAKVTHMLTYDVASSIKLNIYFQKLESQ